MPTPEERLAVLEWQVAAFDRQIAALLDLLECVAARLVGVQELLVEAALLPWDDIQARTREQTADLADPRRHRGVMHEWVREWCHRLDGRPGTSYQDRNEDEEDRG
jgi:hypothetical protein